MELKAKLKSLEEVGDQTASLKDLYVEKDGEFRLSVQEVDGVALANAGATVHVMEEAKKERDQIKAEKNALQKELDTLKLRATELEQGMDSKSKEKIEQMREEVKAEYQKQIDEEKQKYDDLFGRYNNVTITGEINRVIASLDLTDEAKKALPVLLREKYENDEAGNTRVKKDGGGYRLSKGDPSKDMSIEEHITTEVRNDYPGWFKNQKGGTGSPGGNGDSGNGAGNRSGKTITRSELKNIPVGERQSMFVDPKTGEATGLKVIED